MKVWILTMSCASGRAAGEFQLTVWDFELPLGATCIRIRQMATIILAKQCSFTRARMPEFKAPLPSLRLKWIREGVEDYEYIELMKKAGKSDVALELARQLGEDFRHWNADPKLLFAVRRRMGEALDKHLVNK